MRRMGYPTVPGRTFFSADHCAAIGSRRNIDSAYRYAKRIGFPVIVKPNSGSQGSGVALVHSKRDFFRGMRLIFTRDRVALVQRCVIGHDYRIVVLDNEVISAYERIPLSVVGDGRSTIGQLLDRKQRTFVTSSRDTRLRLDDPRIATKLAHQKLTMNFTPHRGERVHLLDNANLSSGGDAIDVTDGMHRHFKQLAVKLTKDMGLRLCGVDLMVAGDIREKPGLYWVLEVNAAPGLDHYVKTGRAQQRIVENLYLKVLKSMER
jgi:D-alanine-D-alanine ligase-like ATP-grasp enzyme